MQSRREPRASGEPADGLRRATLDAGIHVIAFGDPALERVGIRFLSLRWTLAWRTNGTLIEGIGVQPDVSYSETVEDLQWGHKGYRQALLATINASDVHGP